MACAVLLTVPLAVAKTATACGINALGTFSRYDTPIFHRIKDALLYMATAIATASLIGVAIGFVGMLGGAARWLPMLGPVFLLVGLRELGLLRRLTVPTMRWQVPARWVADSRTAPMVWGFFLGSGLATWMPHATFYGLLLLAAFVPFPGGAALMGSYGGVRAVPALAAAVSRRCSGEIALAGSWKIRLLGHALSGSAALALSGMLFAFGAAVWPRIVPMLIDAAQAVLGESPVSALVALGLAALFMATGVGKISHPARFARVLRGTYGLPAGLARVASLCVPAIELIAAFALVGSATRLAGLALVIALVVLMLIVTTGAVLQGATGDCGCIDALGRMRLGRATLLRLVVLLAIASIGVAPLISIGASTGASLGSVPFLVLSVGLGVVALICIGLALRRVLNVLSVRAG
jgi:hypothetical protein